MEPESIDDLAAGAQKGALTWGSVSKGPSVG